MNPPEHHIRRHTLDLHVSAAGTDGPRLRAAAADWQKRVWMPLLERVLDEMDTGDETVLIDRIEVDLDDLTPSQWNAGVETLALERLREAVRKKLQSAAGRHGSAAHRPLEALAQYLRTGSLPWWAPKGFAADPGAWLRTWVEESGADVIAAEGPALLETVAARTRLAAELRDVLFWKVIAAVSAADLQLWKDEYELCQEVLKETSGLPEAFCVACRAAILAAALYRPDAGQAAAHFVEELEPMLDAASRAALAAHLNALYKRATSGESFDEASLKTTPPKRAALLDSMLSSDAMVFQDWMAADAVREDDELHTHYISGAGAVLLAPFLPAFFGKLGLAEEDGGLADAGRAAVLVHHLVSGEDRYGEWNLVLAKILCGLPLSTLVPTGAVHLRDEERTEADALLTAVVEHWSILKNTSIEGLRQSFLQREGRLTEKQEGWRLLVQPAAHDVLLAHLPWSIGIIKLPWMRMPVYVDWE